MNLTFVIPSLNRAADESLPETNLPALNEMLRLGRLFRRPSMPSEVYRRFLWQGSLLDAVKHRAGIGSEQAAVLASPVWQRMGMHSAGIISGSYIGISPEEADDLCGSLTEFYRHENWRFVPLCPDLWLLTLPSLPDWQPLPVWDVCGQGRESVQASGADKLKWLALQTEIQMFLYNHPANQRRASEKQPTINGLWLWQDLEGIQSERPLLASDSIWADFYPGRRTALPEHFDGWQAAMIQENFSDGLIFLEGLAVTGQTGDVRTYLGILENIDRRWFDPALGALSSGRLKNLAIVTDGENGGSLRLTDKSKWAFWKHRRVFGGIW